MHSTVKRYIITGGSGSGKSSIIKELQAKGYACYPEISRTLIKEQQACGGELLPWKNMEGFAVECFNRMHKQLMNQHESPVFFDRGIPDIIAYLKSRDLPVRFDYAGYASYYNSQVFICPPWQEIFVNDQQRPESFEQSKRIHQLLQKIYRNLNFKVIEVPRLSVNERANFILSYIKPEN